MVLMAVAQGNIRKEGGASGLTCESDVSCSFDFKHLQLMWMLLLLAAENWTRY